MPSFFRLLWPFALALLVGCESAPTMPSVPLTGDPVVDGNARLAVAPAKDRALWEYRVAASALRRGQFDEAKSKLDDALALAAANFGNVSKEAAKSRRMFRSESDKPFIGEPYERVMANFYRGIIYWRDGEPDNARALFRSGQLLDSDTEDKTYAGDYVLLDYLDGLVSAKLGGDGKDALQRARANVKVQNRAKLPDYSPDANVMLFVEYGNGPRKYTGGEYGEQLKFFTEQAKIFSARIEVDGKPLGLPPYDDLNYQATTRGGRLMDHVLGNKAVFKGATDTVGDVALIGAMAAAGHGSRDADRAAIGLAAVGVLSKLASAATTPEADIRTWDNLPQCLSFGALKLAPGDHAAVLEFLDAHGQAIQSLTQRFTISVPQPEIGTSGRAPDVVLFLSDSKN
jgi:tetratricopeptide (TPR) repeat protein